jgi:hypothetical protein
MIAGILAIANVGDDEDLLSDVLGLIWSTCRFADLIV